MPEFIVPALSLLPVVINKMLLYILKVYFLLVITASSIAANRTIINTTNGPIRGKIVNEYGVTYYSYLGIPYAENPTGNLRFKPPVPVKPWVDVKDAILDGPVCPQPEEPYNKHQMSEDCLIVNVYVPALDESSTELLPVFVFFHGGDFMKLSGRSDYIYGPQMLLKRGIIVVTFNYRLGALGFLSYGIKDAPGNAGVKDTLLALKWTKANIERFEGNPNKITVGGQSAGASMAHYMMLTKKSTGLFHRAIIISGSALIFRHFAVNPLAFASALANQLNIQSNDTAEIVEELQKIDAFDIVKAQQAIGNNNTRKGFITFAPFVPTAEIENDDAVITQSPRDIIQEGVPRKVQLLIGSNTDEGLKMLPDAMKNPVLIDYLNENFELCIPTDIEYPYGSQESLQLADDIRKFYLDGADISNTTMPNFTKLVTDATFEYGIDAWTKLYSSKTSNKVYYYKFGFDNELNWFKVIKNLDVPGAAHTDDMGYIFVTNATKSKLDNLNSESQQMFEIMTKIITNFVKFGNPSPSESDIGVFWPASTETRNHLKIENSGLSIHNLPPIHLRLNFWYDVYDKYYQYLKSGGKTEHKGFRNIEHA